MDPVARELAERRFAEVFTHLGLIKAYATRRGASDPDALAADVMAVAWRRLADVPADDPRPWLIGVARNLVLADRRRCGPGTAPVDDPAAATDTGQRPPVELEPRLEAALRRLPKRDLEALLLVAWEDLTPAQAARSLGISGVAFRVRLHRARRRLAAELDMRPARRSRSPGPSLEGT